MKKQIKLNAAVFMLSGRKKILPITLDLFYKNWNNYYEYPLFIYTLNKVYSKNEINFLQKKYKGLKFIQVKPKIPSNIQTKDLFFNRSYNTYVQKKFDIRRLGYLHMIYFKSNMSFFGEWGCTRKHLAKYDYLMIIDDDSWFKKKINFNLFEKLKKYPMATAYSEICDDKSLIRTRENLLFFLKGFVKKYKITVKNKVLKKILASNDEQNLTKITYSMGNLDLFSMKIFKSKLYQKYIKEVNKFGGQYKYRWGDIEITNLFLYLYYEKPIYDYKLYPKIYEHTYPGSKPVYFYNGKNNFLLKIFNLFINRLKHIVKLT